MSSIKILCLLLMQLHVSYAAAGITCRDQSGKPVDWFAVYKLPKTKGASKLIAQGLGSLYLDVNAPQWSLSTVSIDSSQHAVAQTLSQIYLSRQSQDIAYALYNDQTPPKHVAHCHGHTKGDVAFDKAGGFWLVHSVPRFPPYANQSYQYPQSGLRNGQTFLCISLDYKYFEMIGQQFLYTWPQIYDSHLPKSFSADNPSLKKAIGNEHVKAAPWSHMVELTSRGKQTFKSFAKYRSFDADLYDAWIAPYMKSHLLTATWQNCVGALASNCTARYTVVNVESILTIVGSTSVAFKETVDHSKWAVTTPTPRVLCIGDINRAKSQAGRAGGTVCFKHPKAAKVFHDMIQRRESCPPIRGGRDSL